MYAGRRLRHVQHRAISALYWFSVAAKSDSTGTSVISAGSTKVPVPGVESSRICSGVMSSISSEMSFPAWRRPAHLGGQLPGVHLKLWKAVVMRSSTSPESCRTSWCSVTHSPNRSFVPPIHAASGDCCSSRDSTSSTDGD